MTIEAACASGGAAVRVAYQAVAGGIHDAVAVCGVERMTHVERDAVTRALATAADWELEGVCGESFLSLNATLMRAYMDKYGVAAERFAPFAITAHQNALTNPNALLHKALDLETYSSRASSPIRSGCSTSRRCATARARSSSPHRTSPRRLPRGSKVRIAGSALATAPLALARRADPLDLTAVSSSTHQAMKQAGVVHDDIDLFEPHDAYTIMTALTLEAAGFARAGAGLDYADCCADRPATASSRSRPSAASRRAATPSARAAVTKSSKRSYSSPSGPAPTKSPMRASHSCRTSAAPAPPS